MQGLLDSNGVRQRAIDQLSRKYASVASHEEVTQLYDQAMSAFADAKIKQFMPILAERRVSEILRDKVAQLNGKEPNE
jgi:hypothetical protein